MLKTKYVIRSGDGFLVCPKTLEMVANRSDPSAAAIEAKRYNLPQDAKCDLQRVQSMGVDAEIVPIHIYAIKR